MMLKKLITVFLSLIGLMGLMTGCGSSSSQTGIVLPLSSDKPTLLFYYTDN